MIARAFARTLLALLALFAGSAPVRAEPEPVPAYRLDGPLRQETLVIARTGGNPAKLQPRLQRVVDFLVDHLEGTRIRRGVALVTENNAQLLRLLRQGRVDIIPDTLYTALLFREVGGAEIFLREWRDGVPTYSGMFITRAGSDIRHLEDLRGKRVAFEDEGSTTGFRLPLVILKDHGLVTEQLERPDDMSAPSKVGYLFAGREKNIVRWVATGKVDAGAISNLDWVDPGVTPPDLRTELRVFHMTEPLVRSVITLRGDLDPRLRSEIKRVLLSMHESEEGREILDDCLNVTRYDEFVGDALQQLERSIELLEPALDQTR